MRKPGQLKHRIDKGTTYAKVLLLKVKSTGLPFDLTGYTVIADMDDRLDVVLGGKIDLNPEIDAGVGSITLTVAKETTAAFPGNTVGQQAAEKPVGDVVIISSGGTASKIAEITFDVYETVAE